MSLSTGQHTFQSTNVAASVTTVGLTTQSRGSGILVAVDYQTTISFVSLTDSNGNTFTQIGTEITDSSNVLALRRYYIPNAIGGSGHTFTLTCSGVGVMSILVEEILTTYGFGIALDKFIATRDNATPFTSQTISPFIADELLWSSWTSQGAGGTYTHTAGGGFTLLDNETNGNNFFPIGGAVRIVSAKGDYKGSWTTSGSPTTAVVATDSFYEVGATPIGWLTA